MDEEATMKRWKNWVSSKPRFYLVERWIDYRSMLEDFGFSFELFYCFICALHRRILNIFPDLEPSDPLSGSK